MYIPKSFREAEASQLFRFISAFPFGVLVTSRGEGLFASHLPFVFDGTSGGHGRLVGHIARANSHHRDAPDSERALVIFTGPNAYISPRWYPSKTEHGEVVPTWNYVAVHVTGTLRFRHDDDFLRSQVQLLTSIHEGSSPGAWKVTDAPEGFLAHQLKAIVGLEVEIEAIEGKWKMSQNRAATDIDGVIAGLGDGSEVAALIQSRRPH